MQDGTSSLSHTLFGFQLKKVESDIDLRGGITTGITNATHLGRRNTFKIGGLARLITVTLDAIHNTL